MESLPKSEIAVCSIVKAEMFYGSMKSQNPDDSLSWASESKAAGVLLPLPIEFETLRFDPFLRTNSLAKAAEIGRGYFE